MHYIVATDLDGTLLDHHDYSWHDALPAINACHKTATPIIFNTSKTKDEAFFLQKKMDISGPIIIENGSALIFDINLFKPKKLNNAQFLEQLKTLPNVNAPHIHCKQNQVECIFGSPREKLLEFIETVRVETSWKFEGFNDWSIDTIIKNTGLSKDDAQYASNKLFSEPFIWNDTHQNMDNFIQLAKKSNFQILKGGRFYHLQGNTNKAIPLIWLKKMINQRQADVSDQNHDKFMSNTVQLICLGDNHNDVDMLNIADYPVCVRSPVANFPKLKTHKTIIFTEQEGPKGWNQTILTLLQNEK